MKYLKTTPVIFLILLVSGQDVNGQAYRWLWGKTAGGGGNDIINSIALDDAGNAYATGSFSRTVDVNPDSGTCILHAMGNRSMFITKTTKAGKFKWGREINGTGKSRGYDVAVDHLSNVYVAGEFERTIDFDPGPGVTSITAAPALTNSFVMKLDSSGQFLWAKAFIGGYNYGKAIAVEPLTNHVYVAGSYSGTVDFDPDSGVFMLNGLSQYHGYLVKLDSMGNFCWATSHLGSSSYINDIVIDTKHGNNLFLVGNFSGTVNFDSTLSLTSNGSSDIFISKHDSSGIFSWAVRIGGTGLDNGTSIDIDTSGNIYTTGDFRGV